MGLVFNPVLLCCVMSAISLTEGRRVRRSVTCEYGTYQHEGKTCCLCPKGYRVINDCTDKNQTTCELCEEDAYMDHPNRDHNCQPCAICDYHFNKKVKDKCSRYSNTVCECMEDHYCKNDDGCKVCYTCDKCEEHGVKEKCTENKNSECFDSSVPAGGIVAAVLVLIFLVLIVLLVFNLRRKKKFCFRDNQSTNAESEKVNLTDVDPDVDLSPFLQDIAETMGWRVVKHFCLRSGMTNANVEDCEMKNDKNYELLNAWYQKKGLKGAYPTLINTLHEMKNKKTADEIQKIILDKQQGKPFP